MMSTADVQSDGPRTSPASPAPRNPRYLTLDHWRGVACLMIIILHAAHNANESIGTAGPIGKGVLAIISRLGIGVPMFFVISGYCIAATSDSARRKPRAPARFFYRRFSRIFPPYWALTLISIVLAVALTAAGQGDLISGEYGYIPHPSILSWPQWLGNLSLTETWRPHLFGDPELKVVGPAWTLCYEEQFYAVCGLILVLAPRHFFACVTAVTLLTLIVAPIAITRPDQFPIQGFFFDGRWLMFAEGVAVYYILNYMQSQIPGISLVALLLVATAALRWGFPAVAADPLSRQRSWELVGSTAFALGLLLLHPWDLQAACARILHPIAVCGQMCYSLYLVHWPVTVVLTAAFYRAGVYGLWPTLLIVAPATIATSIAASWLFHLTVERRFLNPPNVPPKPN